MGVIKRLYAMYLFEEVNTRTQHYNILKLAKMTFKRITGLCSTTHDSILRLMMNVDLEKRMKDKKISAEEKWRRRKGEIIIERGPGIGGLKSDLSRIPVELVQTMNISKRKCKTCLDSLLRIKHMKDVHQLNTSRSCPEDDVRELLLNTGTRHEVICLKELRKKEYSEIIKFVHPSNL